MADTIKLPALSDFSNTPGHVPTVPDNGAVALQQADGLLFTRKADGTLGTWKLLSPADVAALGGGGSGGLTPGVYGDGTHVAKITVGATGQITAITTVAITGAGSGGTTTPLKFGRQSFTPTAGQTQFTVSGGYAVGNLLVYVDSVLIPASDFAATDGSTFTISNPPLTSSDLVEAVQMIGSGVGSGGGGTGPASTDALPEGTSNLYFTQARARAAISATGALAYNAATGAISYTAPTLAPVATSGAYADLTGKPALAAVATSGSASDLGTGTLPAARLPASGVSAGTYGSGSQVPVITTDGTGRIISITTAAVVGGGGGGGTGTVTPSGTFAVGDVVLANTTDGNSIKSGGSPATLVRGLVSGTSGIAYAASTGVFSLAAPTASVLGGVLAATAGTNQFQTGISTSGVPTFAQPSFGNLSGTATAAQLPLPTTTAIGGVQANVRGTSQFVTGISTSTGALTFAQPAFTDLSGSVSATQMPAHTGDVTSSAGSVVLTIGSGVVSNAKLATMGANTLKANLTGSTAAPTDATLSAVLDQITATQGAVLYRGASLWSALSPGTAGQVLTTGGASANPSWATPAGGGNVSSSGTPTTGQLATWASATTIQGVTALPAANFPALTGDLTTTAGSLATTLAATGVTAGSYSLVTLTVDAKGRLTAAANAALTGDVTTTAGSLATTIAAGVVTYAKLATAAISAAADIFANAASKIVSVASLWSSQVFVTLTDAATITVDMSTFLNAKVTLGGNRTLGTPANAKEGQSGIIQIIQDSTGSRTLSYASGWDFGSAGTPTLSTTAGKIDTISYVVISTTGPVVRAYFGKSA